ncbi:MAG: hypothetical protein IJ637_09700 [Prevotella sp.]|nr:hypothetical protein [Prevotella sp.]
MSEQKHHHHHHKHRKDSATLFKERSLRSIAVKRQIEKWLKIVLMVVAAIMVLAVVFVYKFG